MPYSYNPNDILFDPVKKTIWPYNHFTKREIGELRQYSARVGKFLEAGKYFLCLLAKAHRRGRLIAVNISDCFKKLATSCGCK